jgi:hypothetical protein
LLTSGTARGSESTSGSQSCKEDGCELHFY